MAVLSQQSLGLFLSLLGAKSPHWLWTGSMGEIMHCFQVATYLSAFKAEWSLAVALAIDWPSVMHPFIKNVLCAGAVIGTAAYLSPLIFQASYFNFCVMTTSGINDKKSWSQLNSSQQANLTATAVQICNGGGEKYQPVDWMPLERLFSDDWRE